MAKYGVELTNMRPTHVLTIRLPTLISEYCAPTTPYWNTGTKTEYGSNLAPNLGANTNFTTLESLLWTEDKDSTASFVLRTFTL